MIRTSDLTAKHPNWVKVAVVSLILLIKHVRIEFIKIHFYFLLRSSDKIYLVQNKFHEIIKLTNRSNTTALLYAC